jgi:hypothetical protein
MIKVDYLLIAEDVRVDNRNRTSIINVAERLDVPSVPVNLQNVKVTARIHPEGKPIVDQTTDIKFLLSLGSEEIFKIEMQPKLTIELGKGWATVMNIDNLVFPKFGDYKFSLYINDKKYQDALFTVRNVAELSEP